MKAKALTTTTPHNAETSVTPCQLLDKAQLSTHLGVSVRLLEDLVARNEFPRGVRLGRRLLWDSRVAEQWRQRLFSSQLQWRM